MVTTYGKLDAEESIEERIECREIVKGLRDYGVSQLQVKYLIKFLAQDLEERELMITLVNTINASLGHETPAQDEVSAPKLEL